VKLKKINLPKKFFEIAAQNAVDSIYFLSPERQILFWNKSAETLTGYKRGKSLEDIAMITY